MAEKMQKQEDKDMGYMDEFKFWLEDDYFDQDTKNELLAIKDDE